MRERMRVPRPAARTMAAGAVSCEDTLGDGRGGRIGASTGAHHGDGLDLDARPLRQVLHGERTACRVGLGDDAPVDLVDRGPVTDIGQKDGDLNQPIEPAAGGVEDGGEILERSLSLPGHVVGDELAACRVHPELPGGEDELTGTDRLAVGARGGRRRIGADCLSLAHSVCSSMASMLVALVRVRVMVARRPAPTSRSATEAARCGSSVSAKMVGPDPVMRGVTPVLPTSARTSLSSGRRRRAGASRSFSDLPQSSGVSSPKTAAVERPNPGCTRITWLSDAAAGSIRSPMPPTSAAARREAKNGTSAPIRLRPSSSVAVTWSG